MGVAELVEGEGVDLFAAVDVEADKHLYKLIILKLQHPLIPLLILLLLTQSQLTRILIHLLIPIV